MQGPKRYDQNNKDKDTSLITAGIMALLHIRTSDVTYFCLYVNCQLVINRDLGNVDKRRHFNKIQSWRR